MTASQEPLETLSRNGQDPCVLLDEKAAAKLLGYSVRALQNWRLRGGGPKFVKVSNRSIRYRKIELAQWIEERIRASTSQAAA